MVYGYQHRMGNCNICPLAPTVGTDPLKLCMEKRFFAVCRRVGACDKCGAQEPVPFPGFAGPAFACAFVAAGTESCPGSNIGICRESSHVRANDRDDDPGAVHTKPCYVLDCVHSFLLIRLHVVIDPAVQFPDVGFQFINVGKDYAHHLPLQGGHHSIEVIQYLFL